MPLRRLYGTLAVRLNLNRWSLVTALDSANKEEPNAWKQGLALCCNPVQ
jgi:hypothetical protein